MSDTPTLRVASKSTSPEKPDPSTYRQVLKNMRLISELITDIQSIGKGDGEAKLSEIITQIRTDLEQLAGRFGDSTTNIDEEIQKLLESLTSVTDRVEKIETSVTAPSGPSEIVTTESGTRVLGVHVNIDKVNVDSPLSDYKYGVTWEFKNAAVIKVNAMSGMGNGYCAVMTVRTDSPVSEAETPIDAIPFQVAYSITGVYFYKRYAAANGSWGAWQKQEEAHVQFVESETMPTNQIAGDYWIQPLGVEGVSEYWTELIARDEADPAGTTPDGSLIADERNDADYTLETI